MSIRMTGIYGVLCMINVGGVWGDVHGVGGKEGNKNYEKYIIKVVPCELFSCG